MSPALRQILSSSAAASLERAQKMRIAEPTLNLHVAEPIDSIEGQKYGRQARIYPIARAQGKIAPLSGEALVADMVQGHPF